MQPDLSGTTTDIIPAPSVESVTLAPEALVIVKWVIVPLGELNVFSVIDMMIMMFWQI